MLKGINKNIEINTDLKRKREDNTDKKSKFIDNDINIDDYKVETDKTISDIYGYKYLIDIFKRIDNGFFNTNTTKSKENNQFLIENPLISKFQL